MEYLLVPDIEELKKKHSNHKCIKCINMCPISYEDDTPAGRTPYHRWEGECMALRIPICDNKQPPKDCPFQASNTRS